MSINFVRYSDIVEQQIHAEVVDALYNTHPAVKMYYKRRTSSKWEPIQYGSMRSFYVLNYTLLGLGMSLIGLVIWQLVK